MASLPYDPSTIPREHSLYYISATKKEREEMLASLEFSHFKDVFHHIPKDIKFSDTPQVCKRLNYDDLTSHLEDIAKKNNPYFSFLGDGLQHYKVHEIVPFVSSIRGLSTAYTPYQPERSQGTLHSLWIYAQGLSALTGFGAVNSSFYDRSTAVFEAFKTALRIVKTKKTFFISEGIYPGDLEVVNTHAEGMPMNIVVVPMDKKAGILDSCQLDGLIRKYKKDIAAFCFPQINHFGNIEDVDRLTDLCRKHDILSIALVDPILLATGGLKSPSLWGSKGLGTTMFVGEGQHLAVGPNYGGPGIGVFGIVFHKDCKNYLRSTAGRFVGKTKDKRGRDCFCMILSTREQHIRRERATSNICSNQSFMATLVGASLLARGEIGLQKTLLKARLNAVRGFKLFTRYKGFYPAFEKCFFNEFTLRVSERPSRLIQLARGHRIHLGVDVSSRGGHEKNLLLVSFSDIQTDDHFTALKFFLDKNFKKKDTFCSPLSIKKEYLKTNQFSFPKINFDKLKKFYLSLGQQNISPDDTLYPLGSCTMKYNPRINDWAASLPGFANLHPQVPEEDAQGAMAILYNIQEYFKAITGLKATATQPVAGAQGELVGLKMFQAYHKNRGEGESRNKILIPRSAHGTNPASAVMAGFKENDIIITESCGKGQMDLDHLKKCVFLHKEHIAGIMVTNPNTAGIFEQNLHQVSKLIHSIGGLVYMDGANMNAIASLVNLSKLGIDAVHNNLHKTWTIPHGGGGPGDAVVCVSEKLVDYIPGIQIRKNTQGLFESYRVEKSIGSFHRHFGNFAHKVRAYTYLRALGSEGIENMSSYAVLSAQYLYSKLKQEFPTLPKGAEEIPRLHEFIITFNDVIFDNIRKLGIPKSEIIPRIGKLFLDFGIHSPTVAFPEQYGLMIEPTESYTMAELDRFLEILKSISKILKQTPQLLTTTPHFTPVGHVDEVKANKHLILTEPIEELPQIPKNAINPQSLRSMDISLINKEIFNAHKQFQNTSFL